MEEQWLKWHLKDCCAGLGMGGWGCGWGREAPATILGLKFKTS